jgi:hypothetical protein
VGAIGAGSAVNEASRNYKAASRRVKPLKRMTDGNFQFNSNPGKEDVEIITKFYTSCTYSVKLPQKRGATLSIQHQGGPRPDDDTNGGGSSGGDPPAQGGHGPVLQHPQNNGSKSN